MYNQNSIRIKIARFLIRKLYKWNESEKIPKKGLWIKNILFPLLSLYERNSKINYSINEDVFIIDNIKIDAYLFKREYMQGMYFKVEKVDKHGYLHIRCISFKRGRTKK